MKKPVVIATAVAALVAATVLGWMEVRQEREFRRLVAAGDAALARGDTFDAIEAFSGALALKPETMVAHLKRGDAYRRRGEHNAALRDLGQAAALDPTATRPRELLGDVYLSLNRHDVAAGHYREYLAIDDRAPRVLYKLGLSLFRGHASADAMAPLRRAVAIDERFAEAHYLLGMCFRDRGQHADAFDALSRAVALEPGFAAAREELAAMHEVMGHRRELLDQLHALARLEPEAERLVFVGLTYARIGRRADAAATLTRAVERFPDSTLARNALASVWLTAAESGVDPAAARRTVELLRPVAERADPSSQTLTLFGRALLLSGNTAAAERALERATTQPPVEPEAFRYLAEAARRLGHRAQAREARRRHERLAGS